MGVPNGWRMPDGKHLLLIWNFRSFHWAETMTRMYSSSILPIPGCSVSMLDEESQEDLRANKNLGVYKGALYENMVGEALVKQGYKLYYYKRPDSTLEEDFFIRSASSLIPLEVKAKNGQAKPCAP